MKNSPIYSETQEVEISLIKEAYNTRTEYNEQDISELAESIKEVGMLHPLIVCKNANHYQLIAGYQRRKAAIKNNWKTVPVKVLENPSPDLILNIQIIENAQRKDVHPMDEALAFQLMELPPEEIALKIGKSVQYVYDRKHLLKLGAKAVSYFREGILGIYHALMLCRVNEQEQDEILESFIFGTDKKFSGNTQLLKTLINKKASVKLSEAKFQPFDKFSTVKSCENCEHRSGYNKKLFNDIEADDICFNVSCFNLKNTLHCLSIEQDIKGKGVVPIRLSALVEEDNSYPKYNLVSDFEYIVNPIKLSEIKEGDIIGIYFEHSNRNKIGSINILQHKTDTYRPEPSDALREIRIAKANKAFVNSLMNIIGQKIGEQGNQTIPSSIVLFFCETLYINLTEEQKKEINKFNGWDNSSEYNREYFRQQTLSLDDSRMLLLVLLMYGFLKNQNINTPEYFYIKQLCKEWDIDAKNILKNIEEEFQIELHSVNSILNV